MGFSTPFGLRQVKLVPLSPAGVEVPANAVFLPASRTFSFKDTESFEQLTGGDKTVASRGAGAVAGWELEGGGISLEAWKVLAGGTITTSGTTPNKVTKFTKKVADSRPYFNVYGRALSESGGDFGMVVYRCIADGDLEASMEGGAFLLTSASGNGYGDVTSDNLYDFIQNETAIPLVIS